MYCFEQCRSCNIAERNAFFFLYIYDWSLTGLAEFPLGGKLRNSSTIFGLSSIPICQNLCRDAVGPEPNLMEDALRPHKERLVDVYQPDTDIHRIE